MLFLTVHRIAGRTKGFARKKQKTFQRFHAAQCMRAAPAPAHSLVHRALFVAAFRNLVMYAVLVPQALQLAHLVCRLLAASPIFQAVDAFLLLLLDPRIDLLVRNVEFLGRVVVVQAIADAICYDRYAFFEYRLPAFCHDGSTSRAGCFELLVTIILHDPFV